MIIEANDVILNRQKIEKKLIEKNVGMTLIDLAEFFYVPVKAIQKDLVDLNLTLPDKNTQINIIKLRERRDKKILKECNGKFTKEILTKYGLYKKPESFNNDKFVKYMNNIGVPDEIQQQTLRTLNNISIGIKESNTYKNINATVISKKLVDKEKENIKNNKEDAVNLGINLINKGQDPDKVAQMVGYHNGNLFATFINKKGENQYEKYKNKHKPISNEDDKRQIKEDCYNRWMAGECTQDDLAKEYNVTRTTIMNYIREMKLENIENKESILVRRRNNPKEKQEYYNERKQEIIKKFNQGKSLNKIGIELNINLSTVYDVLVKEGLYKTKYESGDLNVIKRGVSESKNALDKEFMMHFGYGPNKDMTKKQSFSDHVRMLNDEHHMKVEMKKHDKLEQAIKDDDGVSFLTDLYGR